MAVLSDLLKDLGKLTDAEILELSSKLNLEIASRGQSDNQPEPNKPAEEKIGAVCPHCGSIATVKCGLTAAGTQRYKCKDCKKTFTPKTGTIFNNTRLTGEQWYELIRGMVSHLSLTKIADNIQMSTKAAWFNRNKILSIISETFKEQDKFTDIAECDECSMHLSFRGKRDPRFFIYTLGRMPRHHRSYMEKIEYLEKHDLLDELEADEERLDKLLHEDNYLPGTNKDSVCILSGKDRSGNLYMNPVCVGSIGSKHIMNHFQGRFAKDAILVTDSNTAYNSFAKHEHIHHEQILSEKHTNGPYSLSRINAVHSNLRSRWPKKGGNNNHPSTKYLDLNLMLFWWQEKNKDLTLSQQVEELYSYISSHTGSFITYEKLRYRPLALDTKDLIPKYV